MGSEWTYSTIADCASAEPFSTQIGPFGNKIKAEIYTPEGAPVLRGTNVNTDSRFHDSDFVFIDQDYADSEFEKFTCKVGDVVLCHKGTLGKIGIIPKNSRFETYIMGNSMMKERKEEKKLNSSFLYYWLCSFEGQDYLFSRVSQVGVPQIQRPLSTLREAEIPLPPLPEQKAIAHILGTLDDKIELNRRMNATLESMAQALFKSWFVDFDPVIDNALTAGNPIPPELAPRAKTRRRALANATTQQGSTDQPTLSNPRSLFPAAFEYSDGLSPIPQGWEVKQLDELIRLIGGGTPKTSVEEYWNGSIPWFSVVDAPNDSDVFVIDTEKKITEEGLGNSSTKLLRPGTTIISARGTVGKCSLVGVEMTMNQSCYGIQGADGASDSYTYYSIRHYVSDLQQRGHGSVFNTITRGTFRSIKVPFGGAVLTAAFEDQITDLLARIKGNLQGQTTLTKLRDTLLPKLISGELRLSDAGQYTEEALS